MTESTPPEPSNPSGSSPRSSASGRAGSPLAPFIDAGHGRGGLRKPRARFGVTPQAAAELPEVDGLLAGAALVDITPPPGLPKAGYSANAQTGAGFHSRIRAAITHLRSGRSSIAIVQLDLLGGSPVLQHLIARAVAERTDVPLAGIWLGATHTHAGPGQFLGSDFYNIHASNKAGFDPAWTQFLVDRIAGGIIEAHDTRGPARLAVGTTEIWGLTRNRSHDPHVHNRTITDKRRDPQRKWVAVNPELHLIRVDKVSDGGATEPLSAAVVFSIHGTGISQKDHLYNADLWGYLKEELGHRIEVERGSRPVVGAMEGTHADVAPALRPGLAGHREARRIGCGIGAEAHELYRSLGDELHDDVRIQAAFREVDLSVDRRIDGIELAARPAVGTALTAGAMENVTPVLHRLPTFKAGQPKRWGTDNSQGVKWVLGSRWLQPLVLPLTGFPRVMPLQALRVDDTLFVGTPFETTVESGRRMVRAIEAGAAPGDAERVVVASVVNDYWGYVATEEEYSRQFYEGGHTLYGPNTEAFTSAQLARLVTDSAGSDVFTDAVRERRWNVGVRRFLASPATGPAPERRFESIARFSDPTATVDGAWEQTWVDVAPGGLSWHDPLVLVESSDDDGETWTPAEQGGRRVDDQGWSLSVSHEGRVGGDDDSEVSGHRYRVRWHDPVMRFGRKHRFVLLANADRPRVEGLAFD